MPPCRYLSLIERNMKAERKSNIGMRKLSLLLLCAFVAAGAQPDLAAHAHPSAQAAADLIKEAAGADVAFLPAGLLREQAGNDLASMLQYPTDEINVVTLKGSQIKEALERSLANYPQPNGAFLQISGLIVTFSESAAPESRILEIKVGDAALVASRQYQVAMPATLARGALGYFKIWDKSQVRSLGTTVESALKGKSATAKAS